MNDQETLTRLRVLMRRQTPITEQFSVSPDVAEALLESNWEGNRSVSQSTVDKYANEMRHGNWMLTGEPFIVSRDGHLIDGQHRAWAVLESGMTIAMMGTFGVDPEAFRNINCGRVRTIAYRAGLPSNVAAGLNFILKLGYGPAEVSQANLRKMELAYGEQARRLVSLQRRRLKALRQGPCVAAATLWCAAGKEDYVLAQYAAMMDLDAGACSPCCRSFLRQAVDGEKSISTPNMLFARAFRAFDPSNARTTKITIKDSGVTSVLDMARAMVLTQMDKKGITFDAKPITTRQRRTPTQVAREARV